MLSNRLATDGRQLNDVQLRPSPRFISVTSAPNVEQTYGCDSIIIFSFDLGERGVLHRVGMYEAKWPRLHQRTSAIMNGWDDIGWRPVSRKRKPPPAKVFKSRFTNELLLQGPVALAGIVVWEQFFCQLDVSMRNLDFRKYGSTCVMHEDAVDYLFTHPWLLPGPSTDFPGPSSREWNGQDLSAMLQGNSISFGYLIYLMLRPVYGSRYLRATNNKINVPNPFGRRPTPPTSRADERSDGQRPAAETDAAFLSIPVFTTDGAAADYPLAISRFMRESGINSYVHVTIDTGFIPEKDGSLFDIIHEAKQELVLVSPYVNLTYWKQLATALTAARDRGVRITFYVRHEPSNPVSKEQVEALGITPQLVANLHAKFYFNETSGLITSLNLLGVSNSNSIEIGSQLETAEEVEELRRFVKQYLAPQELVKAISDEDKYLSTAEFGQVLADFLEEKVDRRSQVDEQRDGSLSIRAVSNTFTVSLERPSQRLAIRAVVSGSEADRFAVKHTRHFTSPALNYEVQRGGKGYYDMIRATTPQPLSAPRFNALTLPEKKLLLPQIADFLLAVRAFKIGDYYDLQNLYAAVHKLADRAERVNQMPHNGLLLGFAYEIRKAYDGHRLTHLDEPTAITYSGFQYLWTDILLVANIMRFQASYVVMTETEQACIYLLEAAIKMSLETYDAQGAQNLKKLVGNGLWIHDPLLEQTIQLIDLRYMLEKPSKKRFRSIGSRLAALSDTSPEGQRLTQHLAQEALRLGCEPQELSTEFPENIICGKDSSTSSWACNVSSWQVAQGSSSLAWSMSSRNSSSFACMVSSLGPTAPRRWPRDQPYWERYAPAPGVLFP
uniref:Uncharacterized protein n=1 Tax=Tanacetum cinerariifolium TaxID=118510 RepID=A0A699JNW1_TANCI|nr:hypothetical protein [Tanacetum cinerariifolium]